MTALFQNGWRKNYLYQSLMFCFISKIVFFFFGQKVQYSWYDWVWWHKVSSTANLCRFCPYLFAYLSKLKFGRGSHFLLPPERLMKSELNPFWSKTWQNVEKVRLCEYFPDARYTTVFQISWSWGKVFVLLIEDSQRQLTDMNCVSSLFIWMT